MQRKESDKETVLVCDRSITLCPAGSTVSISTVSKLLKLQNINSHYQALAGHLTLVRLI
jgi:hypothetical protein